MNFSLSDEQAMLRESVEQFVTKAYTFENRKAFSAAPLGFAAENWQQFAELGWLGLPFSESDGGYDGGPIETMLIMQEFGKGLVVEPYVASIILAGGALKRSSNDTLKTTLLPQLIDGQLQAAFAFAETGSGFTLSDVSTVAEKTADGYQISGEKIMVLNGAAADQILVSARTRNEQRSREGISIFCVPADAAGITRRGYHTVDGMHAAEIQFSDTPITADQLLVAEGTGLSLLETVVDDATLAVCAEATGIMEMLNYKTVAYTKTREQFGVPLSSFQALQHRMVDMFTDYELTRSLLLMAAIKAADGGPDYGKAIAALKYQIGTAGRNIGQEAVQLHGGMGVTDELDVAHYFKRLTTIDTLFGNADYQLERLTDSL